MKYGSNIYGVLSKEPDDPLMREYLAIPTKDGIVEPGYRKRCAELRLLLKDRYPPSDIMQHMSNGNRGHWSDNSGFGR